MKHKITRQKTSVSPQNNLDQLEEDEVPSYSGAYSPKRLSRFATQKEKNSLTSSPSKFSKAKVFAKVDASSGAESDEDSIEKSLNPAGGKDKSKKSSVAAGSGSEGGSLNISIPKQIEDSESNDGSSMSI